MLHELKAIPDFTILAAQFGYTLEKVAANAVALIPLINSLPADTSEVVDFRVVSAKSIKTIWIVLCGFAVLGLIVSCFVKGYDLDQALVTDQGFAIGVKKVDPERVEMVMKVNDAKKLKVFATEKSKESESEKLSIEQKTTGSEWEKLDLFGKRKSTKTSDSDKLKVSSKENSMKASDLEKVPAEQKSAKESDWEKLDVFGKRKSTKNSDPDKLKLSAQRKSEYSKMSEEDTCPMFGKDY